jgi:hypothetical protein
MGKTLWNLVLGDSTMVPDSFDSEIAPNYLKDCSIHLAISVLGLFLVAASPFINLVDCVGAVITSFLPEPEDTSPKFLI